MTTRAGALAEQILTTCIVTVGDQAEFEEEKILGVIEDALLAERNETLEERAELADPDFWADNNITGDPAYDTAWEIQGAINRLRALMDKPSGETVAPDPTRALVNFFVSIYLDYEARNHSLATQPTLRLAMNLGLLTGHKAGVGFELTDMGRAATALAKEPKNE